MPNGEDAKGVVRITPSDPRFQSKAPTNLTPTKIAAEAPTRPRPAADGTAPARGFAKAPSKIAAEAPTRPRPSHQLRAIGTDLWKGDDDASQSWQGSKQRQVVDEPADSEQAETAEKAGAETPAETKSGKAGDEKKPATGKASAPAPAKPRTGSGDPDADTPERDGAKDDAAGTDDAAEATKAEPAAETDDAGEKDDDTARRNGHQVAESNGHEKGGRNGSTPDTDTDTGNDDPADNGLGVPLWGVDGVPLGDRPRGYDSPELAKARTGRVSATAAVPASSRADRETKPSIPKPRKGDDDGRRPRRRSSMFALIAIAVVLVSNAFIAQPFSIPSGSMEQTMVEGDKVLTEKVSPVFTEPERGDIVVFRAQDSWADGEYPDGVLGVGSDLLWRIGVTPPGQKNVIKRVIGLPGDQVVCCDPEGRVMVNGVAIDETYIYRDSELIDRQFGPITVPEGRLFVLGDHRSDSGDSREHLDDGVAGTISVDAVIGRAVAVVWPLSHWRTLGDSERFADVPPPSSSNAARKTRGGE